MPTEQQSHLWTNKRRKVDHAQVDEGRKRVLLIAVAILAARKLYNRED
jgi:hypothetical protein